jgi:hypothetical protein
METETGTNMDIDIDMDTDTDTDMDMLYYWTGELVHNYTETNSIQPTL